MGSQTRAATRYPVAIAVAFGGRHELSLEGMISDLSTSGARVEGGGAPPEPGTMVQLELSLPEDPALRILSRVVRETESGGFAVEFVELDLHARKILVDLPRLGRDPAAGGK